jgi:hypothetical protein
MKLFKKIKIPSWLIIVIVLLVVLNLVLRFNSFSAPFERDEGEYSYSAWILKSGGFPYKDAFLQKPPLIVYTYFVAQLFGGNSLWAPRVLAFVFELLATLVLGYIVSKEFNKKVAIGAMFLFTPMICFPVFMGRTANTEMFMLLPFLLTLAFFIKDKKDPKSINWFLSGITSALALFYKPICLYVLLFIYLVWIIKLWKKEKKIASLFTNVVYLVTGGLLVVVLVLAPVVLKGMWKYFVETAITYNLYYAKMWGFGFKNMFLQFSRIFKYWPFVPALFLFYFVKKFNNKWFYFGLFLTSLLGIYQVPIGHYYIFLMPALAILLSMGLINLAEMIKKIPVYVYFVFILVFMFWSVRMQFPLTPMQTNLMIYGTTNPFYEAPSVALELKKITKPNDLVFVAGSEPEILFYAQRKSVSRFDITYPLIIETVKREDYQKEAVLELQKNEPAAIVYSVRQDSGLWNKESPRIFYDFLNNLISKKYKLVGAYLWDSSGGHWVTKVEKSTLAFASLILFKKI